ncbi:MAG: late competence development ComFB family protein [Treponema sp.]|nr:late competence development ComFB family protein [Treponema sp.]MCL2237636.1 late competence development ComFB family protein [Treponema sp.]
MDIHNTNEELVFSSVQTIFDEIQGSGNPDKFCLCYQCRTDTICYTLNRIEPNYIVSNRGFTRIENLGIKQQQIEADINTLIYKGLRLVNHNMRPTAPHDGTTVASFKISHPMYDIPTISGRIFDGISFEPIVGVEVSLYCDGELVEMRNNNWQNPFTMVPSTPGAFSFWPLPITADSPDTSKEFDFTLRVNSPDFEQLNHFFKMTSTSKFHNPQSYALNRTYKLPDLYLFPPGEAEINEA